MLTDLGAQVYAEEFEGPFLGATAQFYRAEALQLVADCDCPEYLRKAEARLEEERQRVKDYLFLSVVRSLENS
jgi:cullin 3